MIYATPSPDADLRRRLADIAALHSRIALNSPGSAPWSAPLRRQARIAAARSSVSIEGFDVAFSTAAGIATGLAVDRGDAEAQAYAAYAHAMHHVEVLADDPAFRWLDRVVLDLHFDVCAFQPAARPGRWRTTAVAVTAPGGMGLAYVGPSADTVPALLDEVIDWLAGSEDAMNPIIIAAMAHLHLVSIHPFRDGNGRLARVAQALVLARGTGLPAELCSIEGSLAANTAGYYAALTAVQGGRYQPDRDARSWIDFCLTAHLQQAADRVRLIERAAIRWAALEQLVEQRGWPDRLVGALERAIDGGLDRMSYVRETEISIATAAADLRRLVDAGLVTQHGRTRNTTYRASAELQRLAG